jgi:hypothetical protein
VARPTWASPCSPPVPPTSTFPSYCSPTASPRRPLTLRPARPATGTSAPSRGARFPRLVRARRQHGNHLQRKLQDRDRERSRAPHNLDPPQHGRRSRDQEHVVGTAMSRSLPETRTRPSSPRADVRQDWESRLGGNPGCPGLQAADEGRSAKASSIFTGRALPNIVNVLPHTGTLRRSCVWRSQLVPSAPGSAHETGCRHQHHLTDRYD